MSQIWTKSEKAISKLNELEIGVALRIGDIGENLGDSHEKPGDPVTNIEPGEPKAL
jgi:hypothetical protein